MVNKSSEILVVGAGCFGLSTAYHLLQQGHLSVTIIDRAHDLPAVDAASTDINKVVRSSYDDIEFTALAREAIQDWKSGDWDGAYHECGVVVLGMGEAPYANQAYQNDVQLQARASLGIGSVQARFPPQTNLDAFGAVYVNLDGGWSNATKGVTKLMAKVRALGGHVKGGKELASLLYDDNGEVSGVKLVDGQEIKPDIIIVATGAWTPSLFHDIDMGLTDRLTATGQCLATVRLNDEQAERHKDCPVLLDWSSGFYVFPPNEDNVVKFAIHTGGYLNLVSSLDSLVPVSSPRTVTSHPSNGLAIPREMADILREKLASVYPELAEIPFHGTRMCWYTDTADANWVIDFHPKHPKLLFATGGSGHAYKFLPTIGRLVRERLEGTLNEKLARMFAFDRPLDHLDGSRLKHLKRKYLHEDGLVSAQDLRV
ncbi:hypothetical protein BOTBODRAFT_27475 [Botryobasidium botryosum FD-172 SS1]|uniref:FAD dependent oxidoreductase domain-containing protein n=1 Tax=Botryobasidium botryosum (strain FD-172 SS1) TaxID=930990 RepID=A0A067MWB7_BOTB1|nr:hypothetical protein BOTBODRAFT_27475 [Botryobasidium botryosum FD-172 SS1]